MTERVSVPAELFNVLDSQLAQCIDVLCKNDNTRPEVMVEESRRIRREVWEKLAAAPAEQRTAAQQMPDTVRIGVVQESTGIANVPPESINTSVAAAATPTREQINSMRHQFYGKWSEEDKLQDAICDLALIGLAARDAEPEKYAIACPACKGTAWANYYSGARIIGKVCKNIVCQHVALFAAPKGE